MKRHLFVAVGLICIAGIWLALVWSVPPDVDVLVGQSISVDADTRQFTLVVPHHLPPNPSLVFAFHGTGDTPESMAAYSQLNELAARQQFVLVYPAAVGAHWDTRSSSADSINADQRFFDQLLPNLVRQYQINPQKVYAVGMSNGATFAQLLAATRSQQIAAVVAHSGTPPQIAPWPCHISPTLLIVGENDPIFDSVMHYATKSKLPHISVHALGHAWSVSHNSQSWQFLSQHSTPLQ